MKTKVGRPKISQKRIRVNLTIKKESLEKGKEMANKKNKSLSGLINDFLDQL